MFNASKSRKIFIAMMTLMSLISTVSAVDTYQMVWSDEFDGNGLDSTKWQKEVNCNGGGNNELQCYTDRDSNVEVSGGYLKITAKPENYNGRSYTSGRINTKGKASWKYGKFDIRAKLPKGDYLWPAIWMLPRDNVYGGWAASGEIDIMEARGQNNNRISTALHYGGAWPNNVYKGSGDVTFGFDFTADFHVFTCIWEEDQIQFLVDGKVFHTMNLNQSWYSGKGTNPYNANRQPFDQPFYFLLNLAIGGGFFGSESNSLTVQTAQNWASPQLIIDYVRVYQKMKSSGIVPPPAPVPSSSTPSLPVATKEAVCVNKCNGQSCCNDQKLGVVCYNPASYGCPIDISTGKSSLCGGGLKACGGVCFDGDRYDCTISGLVQKEEIISSIIDNTPTIIVPLTEDSSEGETLIEATRTQPNNVIQGNGGKNLVLSLFAVVLGLLLVL